MTKLVGVVQKVHSKSGKTRKNKPYTKWSLLLDIDGEETWVTTGFGGAPADAEGNIIEEGQKVRLPVTTSDYGYELPENGVIEVSKNYQAPPKSSGGSKSGHSGGGGITPKDVQIIMQNSRERAIEFVELATALDAVPITKGKTIDDRAKRLVELEALVDKYTVRYTTDMVPGEFIDTERFRLFADVQDPYGEGKTSPLPDPAAEAPDDLDEPANNEPENDDDDF